MRERSSRTITAIHEKAAPMDRTPIPGGDDIVTPLNVLTGGQASPQSEAQVADPDHNLIDLTTKDFGLAPEKTRYPIRHIALYTADPKRLSNFYGDAFGMKEVAHSDRSSIFVSDGYFNLALLYQRVREEKNGFNHFGFHVDDLEQIRDRAEKAGTRRGAARPSRIPFAEVRLHDPEGNGVDISVKGWVV